MSENDGGSSGTWQGALAKGLIDSHEIELAIIGAASVKKYTLDKKGLLKQWLYPEKSKKRKAGLPSPILVKTIVDSINQFRPDLIVLWGTEEFWGLLTADQNIPFPTLLEIQGVKSEIAKVFYGGLNTLQLMRCIWIREIIKRRTLFRDKRDFTKWGIKEKKIIRKHKYIGVQSTWTKSIIQFINPDATIFETERALRKEFDNVNTWKETDKHIIFTTAAYPSPFKGLHLAIQSIAKIRDRYPSILLKIAGPHKRKGIKNIGYIRWLNKIIKKYKLSDNVEWLGAISACQIVKELQSASVALIPSYIESYCVAMAEAMKIGTPIVAAYTGGTSYLGRNEETCLFFPAGDSNYCAFEIMREMEDKELKNRLSRNAHEDASIRFEKKYIIEKTIEKYRQVIRSANSKNK